jgi:hypothetical protein
MIVEFFMGLGVVLLAALLWFILVKIICKITGEDDFLFVSLLTLMMFLVAFILIVISLEIGSTISQIINN